jgi:pimeloyl-ACP methyl ester carboxylesterase
LHLVGDVIGLLDALGEEQAMIVGQDWGRRSLGTPPCYDRTASAALSS